MGRRAKKAPVVTKRKAKLSKRFKCPFCANDDVVECHMDYKACIGSLTCRLCWANYQMTIHHLNEAIDVHSEWLDDCEAAALNQTNNNSNNNNNTNRSNQSNNSNSHAALRNRANDDDDDDAALPSASGLQPRTLSSSKAPKNDRHNPSIDLGVGDSEDDEDDDDE